VLPRNLTWNLNKGSCYTRYSPSLYFASVHFNRCGQVLWSLKRATNTAISFLVKFSRLIIVIGPPRNSSHLDTEHSVRSKYFMTQYISSPRASTSCLRIAVNWGIFASLFSPSWVDAPGGSLIKPCF